MDNVKSLRWLVASVFLIINIPQLSPLVDEFPELVFLNLISGASCVFLLTRLGLPARRTLWVWIALIVFLLGYYLKCILYRRGLYTESLSPELAWVNTPQLYQSYVIFSYSFVVFCIVSFFLLTVSEAGSARVRRDVGHYPMILPISLGVFSLVLSLVRGYLGIGLMGVETERLPFRLDTVLFRLQSSGVPILLLLCVWIADNVGDRRKATLSGVILLAHYASTALVAGSRAGLIAAAIPIGALWAISGKLSKRRLSIIASLFALTLVFFPIASAVREANMGLAAHSGGAGVAGSISYAFVKMLYMDIGETFWEALENVATRVSGVEGIWFVTANADFGWTGALKAVKGLLSAGTISPYYTFEVYGLPVGADFRAPGILGGLMLFGGNFGLSILGIGFLIFTKIFWSLLARQQSGPVLQAMFSSFYFTYISEGTLSVTDFSSFLVSALMCEFLTRQYFSRQVFLDQTAISRSLVPSAN